ncbi:MAG: molybdopterin molybdotransferase MoeA [Planctomycetaceae bacterium]
MLATGDELVPPGEPLREGQIRNSNETLLVAQLSQWGCDVTGLGIARDHLPTLRQAIAAGLERDILVLTGGVSMGMRDLVPAVLQELGVEQVFHRVQLKPGKPIWFGVRRLGEEIKTLVFGLPGNPVSSMVCSELFIRPAVGRLSGSRGGPGHESTAAMSCDYRHSDDRPTCFPASIERSGSQVRVTPVPWKGSADLRSTIAANGWIAFPAGIREYKAGDPVTVVAWDEWAD